MKNIPTFLIAAVCLTASASVLSANSGVPAQADHVNAWHGVGSDHQDNNNPGDTANDRHNFGDATAGKSNTNPASRSPK